MFLLRFLTVLLAFWTATAAGQEPATNTLENSPLLKDAEPFCPDQGRAEWRKKQTIEGVEIEESQLCDPDNPYEVAVAVKGTNNASMGLLMRTQFAPDTLIMSKDRDNDGDPDEITLHLEVVELNGHSPDGPDPVTMYAIGPGMKPAQWVFAPKTRGMSTKSFIDNEANPLLRLPAPVIRVEQGDTLNIVLENTHYFPHSIHLHGVDHPFYLDHPMPGFKQGVGTDGVPESSEAMTLPADSTVYTITPRVTGTMWYHCHVQPHIHVNMGLAGMLVVEENRPNNWVQTLNIGAGHVRHPSVAVKEKYNREYDLQYTEIDKDLSDIVKKANDPRTLAKAMHRDYDITERTADYFLLNGKVFPYTLRESLLIVKPDEKVKLRVLNSGDGTLSLHTHGHKFIITHYDGVEQNPSAQITRDVVTVSAAQRVDLTLDTHDDGLHSYGAGVWMFHDHNELALTNDGMGPGGGISLIVYEGFMGKDGAPMNHGDSLKPYFTTAYWERKIPVWYTSGDPSITEPIDESVLLAAQQTKAAVPPVAQPIIPKLNFVQILVGILGLTLAFIISMIFISRMKSSHTTT